MFFPLKVPFLAEIGMEKKNSISFFFIETFIGLNPLTTHMYQASKEQNNMFVSSTL